MTRRKHFLILLIIGFVVIAASILPREKEPSYQGRSLSEWLLEYRALSEFGEGSDAKSNAVAAITQIGTNAVPCFLKWLQREPPAWLGKSDSSSYKIFYHLPDAVIDKLLIPYQRSGLAVVGFQILGTNARAAVPDLTRIMQTPKRPFSSSGATIALAYMGKDAIPPILKELQRPNLNYRAFDAIRIMRYLGTNMAPAIPILIQHAQGTNILAATKAIGCLGRLRLEPEMVVGTLTNLCSPNNAQDTRVSALRALANFGTNSEAVMPTVIRATTDQDRYVRVTATNVLSRMTGELPTNSIPAQ